MTVAIDKPAPALYAQSMRKTVCFLLILALLSGACACSAPAESGPAPKGGLRIVTTVFPVYDWVRNVVGDRVDADISMLLDSGVDLHNFQPTAQDVLKIAACDLFLFVGGESDRWVADALKGAGSQRLMAVNLLSELGDRARAEEAVPGMAREADAEAEEPEYDEHIWLSLKNAAYLVGVIGEKLAALDEGNAETYRANAAAYAQKLAALDEAYAQAVAQGQGRTLLFADRFPFRYLCDDYGLGYYAAFSGCSAETEASFETVAFLAGKVDELGLAAVLIIEGGDGRIAQTIVQNTRTKDQRILAMDSMQSVTAQNVQEGASYLAIMERNLATLQAALAGKER